MKNRKEKVEKVKEKKNFKKLILSFKPFYLKLFTALFCTLSSVVIAVISPSWLSKLTNEITRGASMKNIDLSYIFNLAIVLIIFYVSSFVLQFLSSLIMNVATQKYAKNLREDVTKKINKLPLKYFDKNAYGDTLSRLTNDIDTMGQSLQQSVTMLFESVFMIVGVLIAMFLTSALMALTVLCSVPLIVLMIFVIGKFAVPLFKKRQDELGELNSEVEENYSGQLICKTFSAKKEKFSQFDDINQKLSKTTLKAQFFGGLIQPMMSFVSYFAYASVCLVGGLLMVNGKGVTFGTITAFLVYANLFQSPLSQIAQAVSTLQMAGAAASRIFEFLGEEEISKTQNPQLLSAPIRGEIEFKDVCFGYTPDTLTIKHFSAKIHAGMKVAIVGKTGAGKTTIVNLLMRFYDLTSGDILIDGVSIKNIEPSEVRKIFGMVLQDTWIFDGTLKENILFNHPNVSQEKLNDIIEKANLTHLVQTLPNGIDSNISGEGTLSNGQRQLITIARALLVDPPLLILDEATSSVDTRTEILIQSAMDNLTKGRTSFVIAHRLSTIKNADLILVLDDGNIVEQGTHEELMREGRGVYSRLYSSQFGE